MESLVLKDIVLKYYKDTALKIETLNTDAPFGVLGQGGAGKSSLLKVIAGLEEIESGEIYINGREVGGVKISERNISLISALTPLEPRKNVYENLVYPLKKRGIKKEGQKRAAEEISSLLPWELRENLYGKINNLSAEGKAALLYYRAVIKKPDLILVDEPCAFLEDTGCFLKLLSTSGVFFVIASYDFEVLSKAVNRFIVLKRGEIIFDGGLEEIKAMTDKYIRGLCFF